MVFQRAADFESPSSQGQTEKDYTIVKLKTDLRRTEQKVEDLSMEVEIAQLSFCLNTSSYHGFHLLLELA